MRVIAIDGPAGSGKSTVGRAVAAELGLEYLDTGAMYRSVALAVLRRGVDPSDAAGVAAVARDVDIEVAADEVRVDGRVSTAEIRGPDVDRVVSIVAANPAVREQMVDRQRHWATRRGGGVIEGRDIGTVVFPDAKLKVYLTASATERARRRANEVDDRDYEQISREIARRDQIDSTRAVSPLSVPEGAVVIDTTRRSVESVVGEILGLLQ